MRADVLDQFADAGAAELSWQLDGLIDREETLRATIAVLSELILCDGLCWNLLDLATGEVEVVGTPADPFSGDFSFLAELDDHPMIESYLRSPASLDGVRPRRISDLIDQWHFHRTRTYNELFRRTSVEHMLTILTDRMTPTSGRCFTLVRSAGADFSDADLARAISLQQVLRALDVGIAAVSSPPPLDSWSTPTRREMQVAVLMSRGFTAQASAQSLRISPRTVHKHLENLYAKLGTHDRVTALAELRRRRLLT